MFPAALEDAHFRGTSLPPRRTTLEPPDPLFARLKARAVSEPLILKQLLRSIAALFDLLDESPPRLTYRI
ncbi:hypothetical protein [Cyanobium usitatum]|uniref:hypothetical protein n=1 Tax=Cyanobium usitatum TaxID=2304190 RepID=UPI002AD4BA67|nr:hypothetical protein [Cyanobium usitatum]